MITKGEELIWTGGFGMFTKVVALDTDSRSGKVIVSWNDHGLPTREAVDPRNLFRLTPVVPT